MRHFQLKINDFLITRKNFRRYIEFSCNYEGTEGSVNKNFDLSTKRLVGGKMFNPDVSLQRCIDLSIKLMKELHIIYPVRLENGIFLSNEQEVRNHLKEIWE